MNFCEWDIKSKELNEEFDNLFENKFMSNVEIAKDLGVTKAYITRTLKTAVPKMLNSIIDMKEVKGPFDAFVNLLGFLKILDDEKEMKTVFSYLTNEQKEKITNDIKENYPDMNIKF